MHSGTHHTSTYKTILQEPDKLYTGSSRCGRTRVSVFAVVVVVCFVFFVQKNTKTLGLTEEQHGAAAGQWFKTFVFNIAGEWPPCRGVQSWSRRGVQTLVFHLPYALLQRFFCGIFGESTPQIFK